MGKPVEFGVFLPVNKGGFIMSSTAPENPATYAHNRRITQLAEELGLGFAIALAQWRGFGGACTSRIKLFCTMHTMIYHPAAAAKIIATIDEISGGRFGLNLVAGSNPIDHGQMGLWRDIPHDTLYDVATEWITIVRRLWSEDHVSFDGTYYTLVDCVSNPKPLQKPHPPILCAATSDTGMRFTNQYCDASLVNAYDLDDLVRNGQRSKELAAEQGSSAGTVGLFMVVPGDSDADAERRVQHYNDGADVEGLRRRAWQYSQSAKEWSRDEAIRREEQRIVGDDKKPIAVTRSSVVGGVDTLVEKIARVVEDSQFDWVSLYFPDYIADLELFGREVLPRLVERGVALQHSEKPTLRREAIPSALA
jgi:pyrimidine oxygenase